MNQRKKDALIRAMKFHLCGLIDDHFDALAEDMDAAEKKEGGPVKFPIGFRVTLEAGTSAVALKAKASWGIRRTAESEPEIISLQPDMFDPKLGEQ